MELLDRYLQAVKKYLPTKRRDDILEELRANIMSELEDKEAALGRALNGDEQAAVLKQHGHPLLVGMGYSPRRHLVGPSVFPYYWVTLKAALSVTALVYTILCGLLLLFRPVTVGEIFAAVFRFPGVALNVVIWVTLAFVFLDFAGDKIVTKWRFLNSWNPRDLPGVEPKAKNRHHPITDFLFSVSLLLYLLILPRYPYLLIGPGALFFKSSPFEIAPALVTFYWVFVALVAVQTLVKGILLFRASWRQHQPIVNLVYKGIGLIVTLLLVHAHHYVVVSASADNYAHFQAVADKVNYALLLSLKITAIVMILQVGWEVGRMIIARLHREGVARQDMRPS